MKNAAWLFTEDIPENMYTDGQTRPVRPLVVLHRRVKEYTQGFVSRVDEALRRMMRDWTPTVPVYLKTLVRRLDFDSLHQKLSSVLQEWNLNDVYVCVGGLVGYLRPSAIMWAWNTAVRLMMDPPGQDKITWFDDFIAQLHSATEM